MFPTQADVFFWSERRAPQWARRIERRTIWKRPHRTSIHACVNAHAGLGYVATEESARSLCALVQHWYKRGEDVRGHLRRIAKHPESSTMVNPEHRARFASRWLARLGAAQ